VSRWRRLLGRRGSGPGVAPVHVGDPRFDSWEPVAHFERIETARAFRQDLDEAGFDCALTADHPLDRLGRGDIALEVPADQWSDAQAHIDGLDDA
jgi:hypothetical protein